MKFIKCNSINVYKKKLKTQANTHIMAHVPDITHIGLEDPVQSFLVFAGAWKKHEDIRPADEDIRPEQPAWQLEALPEDALREINYWYSKNLYGLQQPVFDDLDPALVALLAESGRITPPTSPRLPPEAPGAPIAPSRPQRLALALETAGGTQASGQPLATTVRALFAVVPDA